MKWFALAMSMLYIVVGGMLLFTESLWQVTRYRIPLGILLMVYGVVRGFMWRRKLAQSKDERD